MKEGQYLQMNTNLLQLENEFYSTIRPKPNVKSDKRPLEALTNSGIEYVEVRALDLNPYAPLGIDAEQIRFLDTFLLHCLLAESPQCNEREFFEVASNLARVVEQGRDPALILHLESEPKVMREWAHELFDDLTHSASMLDQIHEGSNYEISLNKQLEKIDHPELTPSGRILGEMQENQLSFFECSIRQSRIHRDHLVSNSLDVDTLGHLRDTSAHSLVKQQQIEATDTMSFDDFLKQWNEG
jgi:glutamate--cysteine ligase